MEKTVYFIRHGETDFNRQRIVQGSGVDSALNEKGKLQGIAFFEKYQHIGFDTVLTSALIRTHQTVAPFIESGHPWEQFTEINEISWGIHEGKRAAPWMRENYLSMAAAWAAGDYHARIPGGESAYELGERISTFLQHLRQREEKRILVCSHGRTLVGLRCLLENRPLKDMQFFKQHNTGLTKAAFDGMQFEILLDNDISHLQP